LPLREGVGEALAAEVFLDLEIGFGVVLGFGVGVAVGFGAGVARGVGFGVGDGNSISLFTPKAFGVATVFLSSVSSSLSDPAEIFDRPGGEAASFSCSAGARFPALPSQTMFSGLDEARAAALQRISPAMRTTCASAMRMTFRQKDFAGFVTLNR